MEHIVHLLAFLEKKKYESVMENIRLANRVVRSIQITLPVSENAAKKLRIGELVKLVYKNEMYGVLKLPELYVSNNT